MSYIRSISLAILLSTSLYAQSVVRIPGPGGKGGAGGGGGTPTFVNHNSGQLGPNGGTSSTVNCSGANLIVACVHYYTGLSGVPSVTDSSSNGYTALTNYSTSILATRMFYAQNASSSASFSVSVSGTSIYTSVTYGCFSGMSASGVLQAGTDQGNTSSSTPTTLQASASASYVNNSLLVSCLTTGATDTATITGPPTYTITDQPQWSSGNYEGGAFAYSIQSSSSSTQPTWGSLGSSQYVTMGVAAFH